jgi:hypothetical protein
MGQGGLEPPFPDFQTGTLPLELPTRDFLLRLSAANGLRSRRLPVDNRTLCRMSYGGENFVEPPRTPSNAQKTEGMLLRLFSVSLRFFSWAFLGALGGSILSSAEGEGFEPSVQLSPDSALAPRRNRPLCQPSNVRALSRNARFSGG